MSVESDNEGGLLFSLPFGQNKCSFAEKGGALMTTIEASFASVDEAELAIARLRRSIPGFTMDYAGPRDRLPGDAPYRASVLYPAEPVTLPQGGLGQGRSPLGSRVLFTGDILGLPIYRRGRADLRIQVADEAAERTGALLINAGAHGVKKQVRDRELRRN